MKMVLVMIVFLCMRDTFSPGNPLDPGPGGLGSPLGPLGPSGPGFPSDPAGPQGPVKPFSPLQPGRKTQYKTIEKSQFVYVLFQMLVFQNHTV